MWDVNRAESRVGKESIICCGFPVIIVFWVLFLHLPQEHRMNMEQDELGCFHTHPTYEHLITCFLLVQLYPTWIAGTAMFQHVMDHDLGDAWRCSELIFGGNMFRSGKEMKELLIQGEFLGIVLNVTLFFFVVFVCLIFDYCFYLHIIRQVHI